MEWGAVKGEKMTVFLIHGTELQKVGIQIGLKLRIQRRDHVIGLILKMLSDHWLVSLVCGNFYIFGQRLRFDWMMRSK